ncbi:unnamed protein product, partial [Ixodes pacificus]
MPRSSSKWTRKRTFKGNRFTSKKSSEKLTRRSASFTKLGGSIGGESFDVYKTSTTGFRLIDFGLLRSFLQDVAVCKKCNKGEIILEEAIHRRSGLASCINVTCSECDALSVLETSRRTAGNVFEVNQRFVYALRTCGKGLTTGRIICAVLNLPPPPRKFASYNARLLDATTTVVSKSMAKAAEELKKEASAFDGELESAVTVDGTWMKRGYSSLHGVVAAVSADTGKVLDFEVESKFCHMCARNLHPDDNLSECKITYDGPFGGMESAGAVKIFGRSVEKHQIMYTTYIGDGDSKAYIAVRDSQPYEKVIEKHECVGHVQKRMGTRLRNIKKNEKRKKLADGLPLSGKGRLTEKDIDSIQVYYGKAIWGNTDSLENMRRAVWAIYFHKLSTDTKPNNGQCPKGSSSWCGYNRCTVEGNLETYSHKNYIPEAVMEVIKPVFKALSDPGLLTKCLHGRTQNTNESLNQLIWCRCPKTTFVSADTLKTATNDAVACYNDGNSARTAVLEALGIVPGVFCDIALKKMDKERVERAEFYNSAESKKRRRKKRNAKKGFRDTRK